jgi:ribonuclease J
MMMINLMKPKYYFPVMGEYRHQVENAMLARNLNIEEENILLNLNGEVATFENGKLVNNDTKIKVEDILIDGKTVGDIGDLVLKDREILSDNGIVIVNVNIDKEKRTIINKPNILTKGFIYVKENIDIIKESENIVESIVTNNVKENYIDYNKIKMEIREKLGKYFYKETECKPMVIIIVQEI